MSDILTVSVTEAKKNFTKIIRASEEKKHRIIVLRRGSPVAIILPYEEYQKSKKNEALSKISEARATYHLAGISAQEVYELSKKELEDKR